MTEEASEKKSVMNVTPTRKLIDPIGRITDVGTMRHPEQIALRVIGGRDRTWAELHDRATRLANALLDWGLQPGDRVAGWLETCPEYVELYLAAAKAALVVTPVNSMFTVDEAQYQVDDSGARALVYGPATADKIGALVERTGVEMLAAIDADPVAGAQPFENLVATGTDTPLPLPDPDSLFIIAYTSGTTGRPKGAMLSHTCCRATARVHANCYRTPVYSRMAYHSNMSFAATVTGLILPHLHLCGTVVMTGKVDVQGLIDVIEAEQCTFVFLPTPWMASFAEVGARRPEAVQSLRTIVHTTSKADPAHIRRLVELVGPIMLEGWGMTENSGALMTSTDVADIVHGLEHPEVFESAGRPVVEAVVRVVDENGNDLPHDGETIGELIFQSASMMLGYWNMPEATAKALRDGWCYSGDLGLIDEQGYVYVTERRNDLIVSGGMNVYPTEIEHSLAGLDGVAEVTVIGVPHERWGQTPVAVVVVREGHVLTEGDVIDHCREHLATYKKPTQVVFVDALPRNASNKVLRHVLRRQLSQPDDSSSAIATALEEAP